ncbi:MAG: hypothetical protein JRC92_08100 [Deltaproteobacteria bacterium]|nr:hypothetical protein [Deltaproteobacteria bacterium]
MASTKKHVRQWFENPPVEAPKNKVEAVLNRYFKGQYRRSKHTVVRDSRLEGYPDFGPQGEFTIAFKGGRKVLGVYLQRLAEAVVSLNPDDFPDLKEE